MTKVMDLGESLFQRNGSQMAAIRIGYEFNYTFIVQAAISGK